MIENEKINNRETYEVACEFRNYSRQVTNKVVTDYYMLIPWVLAGFGSL